MKYEDVTEPMRIFIGTREMMRRLGFAAEDIYCASALSARKQGALSCFLTLRTGGKEFNVECGPIDSVAALEAEYKTMTACINSRTIGDDLYWRFFEESEAYQYTDGLIAALRKRGIVVPILTPSKHRVWS